MCIVASHIFLLLDWFIKSQDKFSPYKNTKIYKELIKLNTLQKTILLKMNKGPD